MTNPTSRTLAGIDISVLDRSTVTVDTLHADAAEHPVTVTEQTLGELYVAAAAAAAERLRTGLAEHDVEDVLARGSAAFVNAAAVLRCLTDTLGAAEPAVRERRRQLAADLTTEAGALALAADQMAAGRSSKNGGHHD
ncbi:MAG: hypothetical protein ACLGHP_09365 [Vicinamibacteria bacterium]